MKTNTIEVTTSDGSMEIYEAAPDQAARQAMVVIQEAFGVNDHIRDVTERFAREGFHAVAPSLFHRSGGESRPTTTSLRCDSFSKTFPMKVS